MDLSNAFDCILHELVREKIDAYGFSENALTFFFSRLKQQNQSVQINSTCSIFQLLLCGVLPGSILCLIHFNLFINDIFIYFKTLTFTILLMKTSLWAVIILLNSNRYNLYIICYSRYNVKQ